VITIDPPW
jgi:mRNA m6A methyltransferase catalytic subunit